MKIASASVGTLLFVLGCGNSEGGDPTPMSGAGDGGGGMSSGGARIGVGGGRTSGGADAGGSGASVGVAGDGTAGDDAAGGAGSGTDSRCIGGPKLGCGCSDDLDCSDDDTPGLVCATEKDVVLGGGAAPKGLCTAPCIEDANCASFGQGAICFPFNGALGNSYCIEGCSFGSPGIGETKCHDRPEFACSPALLAATADACTSAAQCAAGEICIPNDPRDVRGGASCGVVVPACLPACRGDIDCADGMFCDQSFLSGVCITRKPTGKNLGEACTVKAEPDECLGFCQADFTGGSAGHCAQSCGLVSECAWNSENELFDGLCLYASVLTQDRGAPGDFGFCTPTCNCSSECGDPALACSVEPPLGRLPDGFRGPGLCFSDVVEELDECSGAGGAGGAGF